VKAGKTLALKVRVGGLPGMKVGFFPLFAAVVVAAVRAAGSPVTADVCGTIYLLIATLMLWRPQGLALPSRT
jgi:hypothetical protein